MNFPALQLALYLPLLVVFEQMVAQEVIRERKIYKQVDSTELYTDVFYASSSSSDKNPAIAFFHGGGWSAGSPAEFYEACRRYAKKGFVTFSFQYRLSVDEQGNVPHPNITPVESVKDARSAIRWLRANAESLYIDPDKIVVGGQSAGGQLALSLAINNENLDEASDDLIINPLPNAILLYASCVNTINPWCEYLMAGKKAELWAISPYHNLEKGLPPAIAFHGKNDEMSDYWTVAFYERETKKLGNYFELIIYEGREHYLGADKEKYSGYFDEEIMERTDKFLKKFGFMN